MEIDTWEKLAWRYRFNKEANVDIEKEFVEYEDTTYKDLGDITRLLSYEVMCKACRIHKIDKGNGSFRYVYAPNQLYKEHLQSKLPYLEYLLDKVDIREAQHAFRSNKNAVTYAKSHIGYDYSAKFDMKSFFDFIRPHMVPQLSEADKDLMFIKDAPRQGLPTSPLIASIAFTPTLYDMQDELKTILGKDFMINQYADDITVSFNQRMKYEDIKAIVYKHILKAGFQVNYKKTKLKFGHKNGMRRIICGIGVGKYDVHRTRETKIKIREALHRGETSKALGLIEWSKCRPPRKRR